MVAGCFFAILLMTALVFVPLGYADSVEVTTYEQFKDAIETPAENTTINIQNNITADPQVSGVTQKSSETVIKGNGYTIDANQTPKIIANSSITVSSVTMTNFASTDKGGAMFVGTNGYLEVNNSTFTANKSNGWSGAIHLSGKGKITDSEFNNNTAEYSGVITAGTGSELILTDVKFTSNTAEETGALGIYKNAVLTNVTFTSNTSTSTADEDPTLMGAGAVGTRKKEAGDNSSAKLDITDSVFVGNKAELRGGAIDNYFANSEINKGSVYVSGTTFENNEAGKGGAIYNHDTDETGNTVKMKIEDSVFNSNKASTDGGAIYNEGEMVINAEFYNNESIADGGAIYNEGKMEMDNSNFYNNKSTANGGAIHNESEMKIENSIFDSNTASIIGGAIFNKGDLTINSAVFSSNTATASGAIHNEGKLVIDNSSFEGNSSFGNAGAIYNTESGYLEVNNSTFTGNKAVSIGGEGGGAIYNEGTIVIRNSKFSDNSLSDSGVLMLSAQDGQDLTEKNITLNKEYNDIFNNGDLYFLDGTTTIDGGIVGNGTTTINGGKLVLGEDAVLKQTVNGTGEIEVGKVIIENGKKFEVGTDLTKAVKIKGDLYIEKGGIFEIQTNSNNAKVDGKVSIDPDSYLVLNNTSGKYYVPETFTLIEANEMNDFEYNPENVTFIDYDANGLRKGYGSRISTSVYVDENNNLVLKVERNASEYSKLTDFKKSHNEQEVAKMLDSISTGNGGSILPVLRTLENYYYYEATYDPKALKNALNELSGVVHANTTLLTFTNAKIEQVYDKINIKSSDMSANKRFHDKIWGQYYYNTYNVDKNANSPKFDTSVNGFLVGLDLISTNDFTVGAMAGYGTSELKQLKDKTTMNDINFGFYGGYETDNWIFKGMLLGGYEQYKTDRKVLTKIANSEYRGFNTALDVEAGYKVALNTSTSTHKLTLTPYVGVMGNYVANEGFNEKGSDVNLKVKGYKKVAAQARLGLGINGKIKKFSWYAKAGIKQFLTDDYNEIEATYLGYQSGNNMKIRSAELGKFSYSGGFGADYALSDVWTVFANGLANFADKTQNYYGNIGLKYKFAGLKKETKDVDRLVGIVSDLDAVVNDIEKNLKTKLQDKEKELKASQDREKELQEKIQKYESNVNAVNEQTNNEPKVLTTEQAQEMKQKVLKTIKLEKQPNSVSGTSEITPEGKDALKVVAKELESHPNAKILIEGHTDSMESDESNQKLSEQRATAIANILTKDYNVKNQMNVIGKGKNEPIATNDTPEGRAKNRRVEISVITAE